MTGPLEHLPTLIAQLQARNVALSSERDACRDESRRLADALADSQAECERLVGIVKSTEGALTDAGCVVTGDPSDHPGLVRGLADFYRSTTGAPRPPRDESVPPPGFVYDDGAGTELLRGPFEPCDLARAWRIYDAEHGYAPAPALPDHGASLNDLCDELGAMMRSWMEPHSDGSDRDFDAVHDIREVISRFRSPVTRSEPTRAEPVLPGLQALQYANEEALRGQVEREIADWLELAETHGLDKYETYMSLADRIRRGTYRKPAAACPPERRRLTEFGPRLDAEQRARVARDHAAERPRHPLRRFETVEEQANRLPSCTCPAASEYDPPCARHGVLGIGVTGRDPAPEAQRAQSEPALLRECREFVARQAAQKSWPWADALLARIDEYLAAQRTPAPNIAAAVAELETATHAADMRTMGEHSRRALAHLGGAK